MVCSEARLAAKRANALKSTGPRTDEGKEASRRNSLRHGLTGAGIVIPGEDAGEVARQSAALLLELAPDGLPTARLLAERVATLAVRLKRSARHEEAATAERCRVAALDFDAARAAEAARLFEAIDEATNRDELLAMPEGVDLLDAALADLRVIAIQATGWSGDDSARLARCLGGDLREPGPIVERIDAERGRLGSIRPKLDLEAVARDRAAAIDLALVDDSPESLRSRRYEAATERAIHQALREIRRWRRPEPAPAAPPTKPSTRPDPSPYRMPAHLVREAEEMRELLSGLPPIGVAAHIPPLGSIFPAGFDLPELDDESMDTDGEPAPHGRSRYEDRRKRPRLGR